MDKAKDKAETGQRVQMLGIARGCREQSVATAAGAVLNKWYCNDNLDAEHKACSVPQELSDAVINVELN